MYVLTMQLLLLLFQFLSVSSDHSGTTQQGAQQPPATENLRETNVELREERREPEDQSRKPHQYFLRGSLSALSFPKLPGDVKD